MSANTLLAIKAGMVASGEMEMQFTYGNSNGAVTIPVVQQHQQQQLSLLSLNNSQHPHVSNNPLCTHEKYE